MRTGQHANPPLETRPSRGRKGHAIFNATCACKCSAMQRSNSRARGQECAIVKAGGRRASTLYRTGMLAGTTTTGRYVVVMSRWEPQATLQSAKTRCQGQKGVSIWCGSESSAPQCSGSRLPAAYAYHQPRDIVSITSGTATWHVKDCCLWVYCRGKGQS